ncbi:MAG: hypothetical protein HY941_09680 [Gammaproteobacteria bacterium]|nr:hypothetical protein [Gammaproteobacteria bacterium]
MYKVYDVLYPPSGSMRIAPQEGHLALSPPDLPHEVAENRSAVARLPIGMNIGPA